MSAHESVDEAERLANLAETTEKRRQELNKIAAICRKVPLKLSHNPVPSSEKNGCCQK